MIQKRSSTYEAYQRQRAGPLAFSEPVKELASFLLVLGIGDDALTVQVRKLAKLLGNGRRRHSARRRVRPRWRHKWRGICDRRQQMPTRLRAGLCTPRRGDHCSALCHRVATGALGHNAVDERLDLVRLADIGEGILAVATGGLDGETAALTMRSTMVW